MCVGRFPFPIKEAERKNSDLKRGQIWKGNHAKYIFICKVHGEYLQGYANHQVNRKCPQCRESLGEKRVFEYLKVRKLDGAFQRQVKFPTCKNRFPLPFDFGSIEEKILIEYHGEQHYKPMRFRNAKQKFISVKKHDKIKKTWARNNGWILITIPYTIKNIESYLDKRLIRVLKKSGK